MREAKHLQYLTDGAFVVGNAKAVFDDRLQVDATPPDNAVDSAIRAGLDDHRQLGQLLFCQPGRIPLRADVAQAIWTKVVEPMDPVAKRLPIRAACSRIIPSRTAASDNRRRL